MKQVGTFPSCSRGDNNMLASIVGGLTGMANSGTGTPSLQEMLYQLQKQQLQGPPGMQQQEKRNMQTSGAFNSPLKDPPDTSASSGHLAQDLSSLPQLHQLQELLQRSIGGGGNVHKQAKGPDLRRDHQSVGARYSQCANRGYDYAGDYNDCSYSDARKDTPAENSAPGNEPNSAYSSRPQGQGSVNNGADQQFQVQQQKLAQLLGVLLRPNILQMLNNPDSNNPNTSPTRPLRGQPANQGLKPFKDSFVSGNPPVQEDNLGSRQPIHNVNNIEPNSYLNFDSSMRNGPASRRPAGTDIETHHQEWRGEYNGKSRYCEQNSHRNSSNILDTHPSMGDSYGADGVGAYGNAHNYSWGSGNFRPKGPDSRPQGILDNPLERRNKVDMDRPCPRLLVVGLPMRITEGAIVENFRRFGAIDHVEVFPTQGRGTGVSCYLYYRNCSSAIRCLKGKNNFNAKVMFPMSDNFRKNMQHDNISNPTNNQGSLHGTHKYHPYSRLVVQSGPTPQHLVLKGIAPNIGNEHIMKVVEPFGHAICINFFFEGSLRCACIQFQKADEVFYVNTRANLYSLSAEAQTAANYGQNVPEFPDPVKPNKRDVSPESYADVPNNRNFWDGASSGTHYFGNYLANKGPEDLKNTRNMLRGKNSHQGNKMGKFKPFDYQGYGDKFPAPASQLKGNGNTGDLNYGDSARPPLRYGINGFFPMDPAMQRDGNMFRKPAQRYPRQRRCGMGFQEKMCTDGGTEVDDYNLTHCIYVAMVPSRIGHKILKETMESFGPVESISTIQGRTPTTKSLFVNYRHIDAARNALNSLRGCCLFGMNEPLIVELAHKNTKRVSHPHDITRRKNFYPKTDNKSKFKADPSTLGHLSRKRAPEDYDDNLNPGKRVADDSTCTNASGDLSLLNTVNPKALVIIFRNLSSRLSGKEIKESLVKLLQSIIGANVVRPDFFQVFNVDSLKNCFAICVGLKKWAVLCAQKELQGKNFFREPLQTEVISAESALALVETYANRREKGADSARDIKNSYYNLIDNEGVPTSGLSLDLDEETRIYSEKVETQERVIELTNPLRKFTCVSEKISDSKDLPENGLYALSGKIFASNPPNESEHYTLVTSMENSSLNTEFKDNLFSLEGTQDTSADTESSDKSRSEMPETPYLLVYNKEQASELLEKIQKSHPNDESANITVYLLQTTIVKICIANPIPQEELTRLFLRYGDIKSQFYMLINEKPLMTFVEYSKIESAERAVAGMNGDAVGGYPDELSLTYYDPLIDIMHLKTCFLDTFEEISEAAEDHTEGAQVDGESEEKQPADNEEDLNNESPDEGEYPPETTAIEPQEVE